MIVDLHIPPGCRTYVKDPRKVMSRGETDEKKASSKKASSVAGFITATGIPPFP